MPNKIIAASVPSFFFLIFIEMVFSEIFGYGKKVYRVNDSINSLSFGIVQQIITQLIVQPVVIKPYHYLFKKYRLFSIGQTIPECIGVFLLTDFCYYWAHRMAHEMNWMWASHSIHHSSENFNLTTALRQASFQQATMTWVETFPKALLGVPYPVLEWHRSLNTVTQFWIHTPYVGNLGFVEYIINTPRQHIIHHSRVPSMCDKNYTGLLSIWDQIFGTFELNHYPDKFGVVDQTKTWQPISPNFTNYAKLIERVNKQKTFKKKIKTLTFGGRYSIADIKAKDLNKKIRYDPQMTQKDKKYCMISFLIILMEYMLLSKDFGKMKLKKRLTSIIYLFGCLSSLAGFMDKSKCAKKTEFIRHISLIIPLIYSGHKLFLNRSRVLDSLLNYNLSVYLMDKSSSKSWRIPMMLGSVTDLLCS